MATWERHIEGVKMCDIKSNSDMSFNVFVSLLPSSVLERAYELYFIEFERMKRENLRIIREGLKNVL